MHTRSFEARVRSLPESVQQRIALLAATPLPPGALEEMRCAARLADAAARTIQLQYFADYNMVLSPLPRAANVLTVRVMREEGFLTDLVGGNNVLDDRDRRVCFNTQGWLGDPQELPADDADDDELLMALEFADFASTFSSAELHSFRLGPNAAGEVQSPCNLGYFEGLNFAGNDQGDYHKYLLDRGYNLQCGNARAPLTGTNSRVVFLQCAMGKWSAMAVDWAASGMRWW